MKKHEKNEERVSAVFNVFRKYQRRKKEMKKMKKELDSAVEQQELETASHKAAKDSNIFDDPFARIFFDDEKVIKKVLEMRVRSAKGVLNTSN